MSTLPPSSAPPSAAFADKLTIETPEQTALEFAIAGIGSRFLAIALDTLIQVSVLTIVALAATVLAATVFSKISGSSMWVTAGFLLLIFSLYYGYFAAFEALWNGQTPGKRLLRIRVIKDTGRPMTPSESVGRNLMRIVDQLPFLYGVGLVSVALSGQNKRLGDYVAGTIVVHERELQDVRPLWQAPPAPAAARYGADRLSPDECALVEAFLNRRNSLAPDVRYRMGDEIVRRLRPKLLLPPENIPSNERLLEAIAAERRSAAGYI
jgi:uncharacterized RDD family membrane protein YckC